MSITVEREGSARRNALRLPAILGALAAVIVGVVLWRWPSSTSANEQSSHETANPAASAPMLVPSAYPSLPTEPRSLGAAPVVTAPLIAPSAPSIVTNPAPTPPTDSIVTQPATSAPLPTQPPHRAQTVVRTRSQSHATPRRHRDGTFRPEDP